METDARADANIAAMRARVGGQAVIALLQEMREEQGPRSRRDCFFARHVFRDRRGYGLFWQAMAQKRVADSLSELGPKWIVLHDLPVRGETDLIDHLVLGPGGVFALSTWPVFGQDIWVGGRTIKAGKHEFAVLPMAEKLADLAAQALSDASGVLVSCGAVLVLVNEGQVSVPITPIAVKLTTVDSALEWLRGRPVVLDDDGVSVIRAAAERPSTWSDQEMPIVHPGIVLDGYSSILLEIEDRQNVLSRWKIARRVGGWVIFLAAAAAAIPVMLAFMPA